MRQSGTTNGRIMRVIARPGLARKVVCGWVFGGKPHRDIFCISGLRRVERGFVGVVTAAAAEVKQEATP